MSRTERKAFLLSRAAALGLLSAASFVRPSVEKSSLMPVPHARSSETLNPSERARLRAEVAEQKIADDLAAFNSPRAANWLAVVA